MRAIIAGFAEQESSVGQPVSGMCIEGLWRSLRGAGWYLRR